MYQKPDRIVDFLVVILFIALAAISLVVALAATYLVVYVAGLALKAAGL